MNAQYVLRKLQDAQELVIKTVPEAQGRAILDLIEDAAFLAAEAPGTPADNPELAPDLRDLFVWGCGTAEVYGKPD